MRLAEERNSNKSELRDSLGIAFSILRYRFCVTGWLKSGMDKTRKGVARKGCCQIWHPAIHIFPNYLF